MKGTETYANLGYSEPVCLQRQVATLTRAVVVLSVLVALLFVGLVCMAVLLYGELRSAQRRGVELELPELDQTWRTTEDSTVATYIKKVIQQVLQNNTHIDRDKEETGGFLPLGPYQTTQGEAGQTFLAKPMGHLTGSTTADPQFMALGHARGAAMRVKEWESNQGLATLANGMKYRDGYIRVPVDGLYYVYR
ncbi:uncharacterized protein [Branchiostoma lanceolatum]|uniref:uncharacterized protein n=1 Tax=Branchiostoma lanceolatum TaxID=7740 RepID=UPI003455658C